MDFMQGQQECCDEQEIRHRRFPKHWWTWYVWQNTLGVVTMAAIVALGFLAMFLE